VPLCAIMLVVGIYPTPLIAMINTAMQTVLRYLG
jgi:hypothetical protein